MLVKAHSLNISDKYVPNWSSWEVAREVICNAIDADPDGMTIERDGASRLVITTKTSPTLAQLFIVGEGTKVAGGDTIGQFGEGFKLAAMAATRGGGKLTASTRDGTIEFTFAEVMGANVLFASVSDDVTYPGCRVEIEFPGINLTTEGKILKDRTQELLPRKTEGVMRVFYKGVYIGTFATNNAFDWNFTSGLKINRDRDVFDHGSLVHTLGSIAMRYLANSDERMLTALFENPSATEFAHTYAWNVPKGVKAIVTNEIKRRYAKPVIVPTGAPDMRFIEKATSEGYELVVLPDCIYGALKDEIDSAESLMKKHSALAFDFVRDLAPYADKLAKLAQLGAMLNLPTFKTLVFKGRSSSEMGYARHADMEVLINEALFHKDGMQELYATYLHEAAHLIGNHADATKAFEWDLTALLGQLAVIALD